MLILLTSLLATLTSIVFHVATVQALMHHANVSVTMNTYVQAVTRRNAKRNEASSNRLEKWPQMQI